MITLNRYPLSAFGLVPTDITSWLTASRADRTLVSVPGRVGSAVGPKLAAEPRFIEVGVLAYLSAYTDRDRIIARVESVLMDQRVAIETADRPNLQTWAVLQKVSWAEVPNAPKIAVPSMTGRLVFVSTDGGSEDVEPSTPVVLSTTPRAVPMGTLPTGGVVLLSGYTSPVTLTYRPANGRDVRSLTISQAVATGEHVCLNLDTQEAYFVPVPADFMNATRTKINTAGNWPILDPGHAAGLGLLDGTSPVAYPTITISSGTGVWIGRRRWRI